MPWHLPVSCLQDAGQPDRSMIMQRMREAHRRLPPKQRELKAGGISKDKIKVGVLHLSDPAEGSGYTYTHDLGIQAMQQNLGLSDEQIDRKINVDDSDKEATEKAIQECVDDGCNIIFTTSWGYMDATEEMAENIRIYILHMEPGTKATGRIFVNYFGRIYQARYLSGIVAGMNTKTNKLGYVAAMDSSIPKSPETLMPLRTWGVFRESGSKSLCKSHKQLV